MCHISMHKGWDHGLNTENRSVYIYVFYIFIEIYNFAIFNLYVLLQVYIPSYMFIL